MKRLPLDNEKLESMTEKLGSMNEKFEHVTGKLGSMNEKFENVTEKFDSMNEKLESMAEKIGNRNETFDNMSERLENVTEKYAEKFGNVNEKLENVNEKLEEAFEKAKETGTRQTKKVIKWIRTRTFSSYIRKFIVRILIFLFFAGWYLWDKELLVKMMNQPISMGITPVHVLWALFMFTMLTHLFPRKHVTMAMMKAKFPVPESWAKELAGEEMAEHHELELFRFVQDMNMKAWKVMLVWLSGNALVGLIYLLGFIGDVELFILTVFYFLSDYLCILLYCPFQSKIMKNRCCVNCRIYDWGHFMMFTPMLFIKNFFSWTLFFTSVIVLIRWEINYAKHPERFWYGSNDRLQCKNCKDRQCQLKQRLGGLVGVTKKS